MNESFKKMKMNSNGPLHKTKGLSITPPILYYSFVLDDKSYLYPKGNFRYSKLLHFGDSPSQLVAEKVIFQTEKFVVKKKAKTS